MIITEENYFSKQVDTGYLSVSQYKSFIGTAGIPGCEAQALASLRGEYEREKTTALLVGSFVDAHFENTLDIFKAKNPDLFMKNGQLKSDYRKAEEIINRIEKDNLFMQFMSGEKQVIMTAEMFGTPWKIKMDSYHPGKCIVDLKVVKSIRDAEYVKNIGYVNLIQYWGYDIQAAVYQQVEYLNQLAKCKTDEERAQCHKLPFYFAIASKEKETDIDIVQLEQTNIDAALNNVELNTPKIVALKNNEIKEIRCESCDYCKRTRVLKSPIWSSELLGDI